MLESRRASVFISSVWCWSGQRLIWVPHEADPCVDCETIVAPWPCLENPWPTVWVVCCQNSNARRLSTHGKGGAIVLVYLIGVHAAKMLR